MRLDIGVGTAEQPLGAVDRQQLGDIDEFAAAIVAPARIALGVLVGEHAALGFEHGGTNEIFRRDQIDLPLLALNFAGDRRSDQRIQIPESTFEELVRRIERRAARLQDIAPTVVLGGTSAPRDDMPKPSWGEGRRGSESPAPSRDLRPGQPGEEVIITELAHRCRRHRRTRRNRRHPRPPHRR